MATVKKHIAKNGKVSYYIRAYAGYNIYGKQIEKTMTWTPPANMSEKAIQKELERQKIAFEEKVEHGFMYDSRMTFSEYSLSWLENNKLQFAPKTYERYKALLGTINIAIGHIRLDKLQSHHLQEYYNNLREAGIKQNSYAVAFGVDKIFSKANCTKNDFAKKLNISITTLSRVLSNTEHVSIDTAQKVANALHKPVDTLFHLHHSTEGLSEKTILHHHRLISSILSQATRDRLITYNIADRNYMRAPKVPRKEAPYLDDEQVKQMVKCLANEPIKWKVALLLLVMTGMRRGELLGLEWQDIDWERNLLHIRRTSQVVSGIGIITKDTKNASSERIIKISDDCIDILSEYRNWWLDVRTKMGSMWQYNITILDRNGKESIIENDRLFIKDDSTPMHPDSITDWTSKFIKKYNLPHFSPHSLRHTNASLLIAKGINVVTVAKRLGHSTPVTTSNTYSHAIKSADAAAAEVLSDIIDLGDI